VTKCSSQKPSETCVARSVRIINDSNLTSAVVLERFGIVAGEYTVVSSSDFKII